MATSPKFNFAQQAGPSSPPATPTTAPRQSFNFKSRRQGFIFSFGPLSTEDGVITPTGNGNTFSYNPYQALDVELSPRSSSPASDSSSEPDADSLRPRSRSSSPGAHSLPSPRYKTRIVKEGNFTVEEIDEEDYAAFDSDTESVLRPHQYEDAESERARSTRGSTKGASPTRTIDPTMINGINNLDFDDDEEEREIWLAKAKEDRRRRRRFSGVSKRSHAQSVGSDTDDEDILPMIDGVNEAGSSARRLRRKTLAGDRSSLIFDDPPPRIEELEEPESCEEVVSIGEDDQDVDLFRNLPYYVQEDMEVDSDDE
ncbi:hypothetical protein B0O99DRAFT_282509 [Bisporella sp. PMI_857]|jgi:hypothetical protein|nr:hypothetical protein B0O99DRAFT_282509 [Bisporella sp. PMI_857]